MVAIDLEAFEREGYAVVRGFMPRAQTRALRAVGSCRERGLGEQRGVGRWASSSLDRGWVEGLETCRQGGLVR